MALPSTPANISAFQEHALVGLHQYLIKKKRFPAAFLNRKELFVEARRRERNVVVFPSPRENSQRTTSRRRFISMRERREEETGNWNRLHRWKQEKQQLVAPLPCRITRGHESDIAILDVDVDKVKKIAKMKSRWILLFLSCPRLNPISYWHEKRNKVVAWHDLIRSCDISWTIVVICSRCVP